MKSKSEYYLTLDNLLAKSMLTFFEKDPSIATLLRDVGKKLCELVIDPIERALSTLNYSDKHFPAHLKKSIDNLARHHTGENRQYGAMYGLYNQKNQLTGFQYQKTSEILSNENRIRMLLQDIRLKFAENTVNSWLDAAIYIKLIIDLGFCYKEFFSTVLEYDNKFQIIVNMIYPVPSEFLVRISIEELGLAKRYQTIFGIGHEFTENSELGFQPDTEIGYAINSGGANFISTDINKRISLLLQSFDQQNEQDKITLKQTMAYFHIPEEPEKRKPVLIYTELWKTMLEKLSQMHCGKLPLVASLSGSSARPFIALLHAGETVLKTNEQFDLNKIQLLANCIMAFIVYAGHHSFIEVAEIYNRVLDYLAIYKRESLAISLESDSFEYFEEKLPYYRYGEHLSFFSPSYKDKLAPLIKSIPVPEIKKINNNELFVPF